MRILYLAQYFPPEVGASQIRALEMGRGLVRAGHQITVIAEVPNHPVGIVHEGYRRKAYVRRQFEGMDTIWVWAKTSPKKTFRTRLELYASYMVMAALAGFFLARGKYDVVFSTSPPLLGGAAGLALSYGRRTPMVFELLDLWPEAAVTIGELKNPRYIRWATRLEEACYERAERIVVTAGEHVERLTERGIPADKIALIRNGSNTEIFRPDAEARERIRREMRLDDKFLAVYAGLHGLVYDLEGLMDVAAGLSGHPEMHFILIGEGPTKKATIERAEKLRLDNVTFLPQQDLETVAAYFSAADVSLAPLRDPEVQGGFPVKVYDSMASALPVIVSSRRETKRFVEENGCGLVVPPGDQAAWQHALLRLAGDESLRRELGEKGREAAVAKYSRQAQARQLVTLLEEAIAE